MTHMSTINIVLSPSDSYSKYCYITLLSILHCANAADLYEVSILYDKISSENIDLIQSLETSRCRISFIDVNDWIDEEIMRDRDYVSKNTYFRIIAPKVLSHKERFIYVDSDMVINKNINELYLVDLQDKTIAAVKNWSTKTELDYVKNELGISCDTYFNAGIVLFDVKKYLENKITEKCLKVLSERQYKYFDQDVLNLVLRDDVMLVNPRWNVVWHLASVPGVMNDLPEGTRKIWNEASKNPYIVHYTSAVKPWNTLGIYMADYFWQTAKKSAIYTSLLEELLTNIDSIIENRNLLPYLLKQQETGKIRYSDTIKVFIQCTRKWIRRKTEGR